MSVCTCAQEWDLALFDFPGQTAEDLSFHKGAIIQVTEHIDAEWRRGRVEGREGLYPAAFTQPHQGTTPCTAASLSNKLALIRGLIKKLLMEGEGHHERNLCEPVSAVFPAQPVSVQQPAVKAVAKFDFTAESGDELTLKVRSWNSVPVTSAVATGGFR